MATPAAMTPNADRNRGTNAPGRPAALWLVLVLTFLGSVGTGAVSNGIFFITASAMGYGRRENLWLGAVFGLTYIAAALLVGPALRALARRMARVSTRGVLASVLLVMAVACQWPLVARETDPSLIEAAVWAMVLVYAPATGVLWPIAESYLSGGRRGKNLRSSVGRFNIVWSVALVGSYWAMAPLLEHRPFWILAGLGLIHAAMAGLVCLLPREPARHADGHEPHPPVYEALLALFRVLLFASYLTLSAVNPLQPIILDRLGVKVGWQMPLASVWLTSRVLIFVLFERWHGWHGRWWTPWTGLGAMIAGFAATVGSPAFGAAGVGVLVAGLALMGAGVATVYCGALYYALSVGSAEVDAGGRHEAVIGMGYFTGPLLGLAALSLAGPDAAGGTEADPEAFRLWTIGLVGLASVVAGVWGWRIARGRTRGVSG